MEIRISALAIQYLKEALSNIYWYKSDLKSFLVSCINNKSVVNNANWELYKRQIISDIVDDLMSDQEKHLGDIRRIFYEVSRMDNFKHLEMLDDGRKKAERARASVLELRRMVEDNDQKIKEEEDIRNKRQENIEKIRKSHAVITRLDEIKDRYSKLVTSKDHHSRGFELEKVLYDIFELFDLENSAIST